MVHSRSFNIPFFIAIVILLVHSFNVFSQQILINEFMSDNESTIQDSDGEYHDWIEFYNNSNISVNLFNFQLTDDVNIPDKWLFPPIEIGAHEFLLIFASGKNLTTPSELHTNFKIDNDGEPLILYNIYGIMVDSISEVNLNTDKSFGRLPDGSLNLLLLDIPSPQTSNNLINQLSFSHIPGFYNNPFYLKIESALEDTIRFSTNGSQPGIEDDYYSDSILINFSYDLVEHLSGIPTTPEQSLISHKAWELPKKKSDMATILRCASFKNNKQTSRTYSFTYFVDSTISGKYDMPVVSLITDESFFFSSDSGIYVPGIMYDPNNPEKSGNYFEKSEVWEKPVHVEFFTEEGEVKFSQNAGIKIHGAKTRHAAQKSLKLYAREEYGKNYFDYKLFDNKEVDKYKRFVLQTFMSTSWQNDVMLKDIYANQLVSNLNIEQRSFQPVVVFLNGEYWGIHNLRDKIDDWYINYTCDLDKDLILFHDEPESDFYILINFIENNDLSKPENYLILSNLMDIDNFIDYQISEMFFANHDWPSNNLSVWRPDTTGGKWRWIFFDIDDGFGDYSYDMFPHCTNTDNSILWPNSPSSTLLFRSLLKNEVFVEQFIGRYSKILNDEFLINDMLSELEPIKQLYYNELQHQINRWNYPKSINSWEYDIEEYVTEFIRKRPCHVEYHIVEFFNLDDFGFNCMEQTISENDERNFIISPNPNDGLFSIYNNSNHIVDCNIVLVNLAGQGVFIEKDVQFKEKGKLYFNPKHLASNTYIIYFQNDKISEAQKIVIMN